MTLPGCEGEPEPLLVVPAGYGRSEGAGCIHAAPNVCEGAETLWRCVDRRWTGVDCEAACADRGGLIGCVGGHHLEARCWCADEAPECGPRQRTCLSDETLERCDPTTLRLTTTTCSELCANESPPQLSRGCSEALATCRCTLVGTPCEPGTPPHCEPFAVARCVDGVWTREACTCPPGHCDPWHPDGARCESC